MTFAIISTYGAKLAVELEAALGAVTFGHTILAPIGTKWSVAAQGVEKELILCRQRNQVAFVWARPSKDDWMSGAVTLDSLPDHPSVAGLAAMLEIHGAQCVVSIMQEMPQFAPSAPYGGPLGGYAKCFDRIAVQMPANVVTECATECKSALGKVKTLEFAAWLPLRAHVCGIDLFDDSFIPGTLAYIFGQAWANFCRASGRLIGVGDGGYTGPGDVKDPKIAKPALGALLKCAVTLQASYLMLDNGDPIIPGKPSGRFTPSLDGTWPGCPEAVAHVKKKLATYGALVAPAKPVIAVPAFSTGIGPVTPAD